MRISHYGDKRRIALQILSPQRKLGNLCVSLIQLVVGRMGSGSHRVHQSTLSLCGWLFETDYRLVIE